MTMLDTAFDIVEHLKNILSEPAFDNLYDFRKHRIIQTLLSMLGLRKEKGYGTGIAIHAFGSLENSMNHREQIYDLTDITGVALTFNELTYEQSEKIEEYLKSLLPKHQNLEAFIAEKLGITSQSMYQVEAHGNPIFNLQRTAEQLALSSNNSENFQINTDGRCSIDQLRSIIEEFCTKNDFEDFEESDIDTCYHAISENETILITVTDTANGNFLISVLYRPYGRK